MKILSMTATFGKLEHETLTLQPGLNIIEAPNEWGKSTWCAFIVAMLYGIDTRERTTQDSLADKERYAPWSGTPMSGRMDILWQGRNVTIERSSKGRSIFGVFRAYETETGLDIPELTAANCGQVLLGVEKSVFLRSGFLKLTDLPVTQDQALWRRLNALVTTGDESGASDALAQKLKALKNQCMSNRANGLIPQVLSQKQDVENALFQLEELKSQQLRLTQRQQQLEQWSASLSNHQTALAYEAAEANQQRLQQAQLAQAQAQDQLTRLQSVCANTPDRWVLEKQEAQLKQLQQELSALQLETQMLPPLPQPPQSSSAFGELSPEEAVIRTQDDARCYSDARGDKMPVILGIAGIIAIIAAVVCILIQISLGAICLLPGALFFILAALRAGKNKRLCDRLATQYGANDPNIWIQQAQQHARSRNAYDVLVQQWHTNHAQLQQRQADLSQKIESCAPNGNLQEALEQARQALRNLDALDLARREMLRAESHADALQALAKPTPAPDTPDTLSYTKEETDRLLSDCAYEQRQIVKDLGRCTGQMESLGREEELRLQLEQLELRLQKLKQTYAALELAQQTLSNASAQLQRRFAPRISQRAQSILGKLTANRFDRLTLDQNFALQLGTQEENTLRSSRWRSDGTIDQLYLALRLAVAEELTPEAPLILDDALVRFDDTRLAAAMDILKEQSQNKQILLFTCQSREKTYL